MKLTELTVSAAAELLAARKISAKELTEAYLADIAEKDAALGAYITVTEETALRSAARADSMIASGDGVSPLTGIPAAVKDNICTDGIRTTCSSRILADFIPPYNATVIEKLNACGMVLLGKTNMDEFAMGSSTENSAFKLTRNPVLPEYVPGGSSGGSAAAVAAGLAGYALGSDTGGSVRQPAAFCGVVGMKPTYGRVSRYGLIAFASSLDQIGPITRDVLSNAIVYDAIAGGDSRDATSSRKTPQKTAEHLSSIKMKNFRIGIPREFFDTGISPEVKAAVLSAAEFYASLGAELIDVSVPFLRSALSAYYIISSAEASSNLARFDGVRFGTRSKDAESVDELYKKSRSEGFGDEVKRRIMLGTFALSAGYCDEYYKKAQTVREKVRTEFDRLFERCDLILSPTAPTTAYKIGAYNKTGTRNEDPTEMYLGDIYTVPVNLAGLPAISLPCGHDSKGLPIGMQLIGRAWDELTLYRAAYLYEIGVR